MASVQRLSILHFSFLKRLRNIVNERDLIHVKAAMHMVYRFIRVVILRDGGGGGGRRVGCGIL